MPLTPCEAEQVIREEFAKLPLAIEQAAYDFYVTALMDRNAEPDFRPMLNGLSIAIDDGKAWAFRIQMPVIYPAWDDTKLRRL